MKKLIGLWCLSLLLVGCGHGFEGEYEYFADSSNELLGSLMELVGTHSVVIGADYLDRHGQRTRYQRIFVRESGRQRYLIFKNNEQEDIWTIIDDNTLMMGDELMNIKIVRVSPSG